MRSQKIAVTDNEFYFNKVVPYYRKLGNIQTALIDKLACSLSVYLYIGNMPCTLNAKGNSLFLKRYILLYKKTACKEWETVGGRLGNGSRLRADVEAVGIDKGLIGTRTVAAVCIYTEVTR